jgi:methionine sulfoxide reductase heme-binding subunit
VTGPNPLDYAWWLASRASGIVALALITTSVIVGLLMSAKLVRRRGAGARLRRVHESTTLTGLVAGAVHGLTLIGDAWLHPGIRGVVVPFALSYRPLFTGLGIIGGYLAAILGLSFYVRRRIGARLWRRLHRLTVIAYALSVIHALGSGTDASLPWLRVPVLLTAAVAAGLFAIRSARGKPARDVRSRRSPRARVGAARPAPEAGRP